MIRFHVIGKPEPGGSKTAFRNPVTGAAIVTDSNRKVKPWRACVAAEGHVAMNGRPLFDGAIEVAMVFSVLRPKGHYRTGRNARLVKDSAPAYPIVKPDVLKLARAVEDALTGVCWRDDALIVYETLSKIYADHHGVTVGISRYA